MHTLQFRAPAALAACLLTTALRAQTATNSVPATNLPPIVVQASRANLPAQALPMNVQIVTADDIAKSGQRTVADVLQKQAGLPIHNFSDNPTTAAVSMRGFGENSHGRVLILVNGERLNNADMSAPNLMRIPVESIKRIEILHGPQTVLYGDFAEAGVINIITDTSIDAQPKTTIAASAGSYDTYSTHLSKSGVFDDDVSYFASADWNKTGGYRDNGDYESYNLDASVKKHWGDAGSLSISSFYHDSEYGLPGALSWKQFKADPRQTTSPNDQADFDTWGVGLGGSAKIGDDGRLDANLTASRRETDSRWVGDSYRTFRTSDTDTYAFTPRYTLDDEIAGHENRLTVGTDVRFDTSSIDSYGQSYGYPYSHAWDYDRTSLAGYAKDEFFLAEKLSLAVGARSERFMNRITKANGDADSYSDVENACDAALLYRPQEDIKLFTRIARYYHAPFVDEVVGWSGAPNTDLVPETGYNFEVGSELLLAKEWTLGLTAYELDTSHEIYYNPTTYSNINAPDDTRRRGVESSLRWTRDRVGSFGVIYDYVDASFTEGLYDGNSVPLVPNHTFTVNGEVYVVSEVALLGSVHYVAEQYSGSDFSNTATTLDDYATLDLAVRYEPAFLKGMMLLAGVDNVCDKDYAYCSYYGSSYYPAAGRTWKLCASYSF